MTETTTIIPPEIIDGLIYLATAIFGWFTRWLQTKGKDKKVQTENEKMKSVILQYDQAARQALGTARRPRMPNTDS